jgi:5-formyltetrahydrofolate cyclo-ligase
MLEFVPGDRVICAFVPRKTEVNIVPFLEEVLRRGQSLFLPTYDGHSVFLREAHDLATLRVSPFNIPEPPGDAPLLDPEVPVVAFIPGRAFDFRGARLGRGNGAYDRWIQERRKTSPGSKYYGTALDCQIVNEVPMGEHDQFLDGVFAPRGLIEARK